MNYIKYDYTRKLLIGVAVLLALLLLGYSLVATDSASCKTPNRLIIIRGTVTQLDHPTLGKTNAIGTLVFQKVGCDFCYIGADIDSQGKYKIVVGDGKYRVMYMDPIKDVEWLAPDQPKFIDTQAPESKQHSQQVFDFDIKLKTPATYKN